MSTTITTDRRQPREHAVTCTHCRHRKTWNIDATCDRCTKSVLRARGLARVLRHRGGRV